MNSSEIALKLVPSRVLSEHDPGHISVVFVSDSEQLEFRGFRPRLDEIHAAMEVAGLDVNHETRRNFLFNNRVPGYVWDDLNYKRRYEEQRDQFQSRKWAVRNSTPLVELRELQLPHMSGYYSFNPDDHEDCNNCVTWACRFVRLTAGNDVVTIPRQGRIKLMVEQFSKSTE